MYNQFGNPYIVYDMHESWVKSQMRRRRVGGYHAILAQLSSQLAQTMIAVGKRLTVWGGILQNVSRQQNGQPV